MQVIEPAQTHWSKDTNDVLHCVLRVPKESTVVGMLKNNLLVKHAVRSETFATHEYRSIQLTAFPLGVSFDDEIWDDRLKYVGTIDMGAQLLPYVVFERPT